MRILGRWAIGVAFLVALFVYATSGPPEQDPSGRPPTPPQKLDSPEGPGEPLRIEADLGSEEFIPSGSHDGIGVIQVLVRSEVSAPLRELRVGVRSHHVLDGEIEAVQLTEDENGTVVALVPVDTPSTYFVTAEALEHESASAKWSEVESHGDGFVLELKPRILAALSGIVTDELSRPLPSVELTLTRDGRFGPIASTETDGSGAFAFNGVA